MTRWNTSAFLMSASVAVTFFAAIALWILPPKQQAPEPTPAAVWQESDRRTLLLMLTDNDRLCAAVTVAFDPQSRSVAVTELPLETAITQGMEQVRLGTLYTADRPAIRALVAVINELTGQPVDRWAAVEIAALTKPLATLGNDLPLTVSEAVDITGDDGYLQLEPGTHVLAASQVGLLLRHCPALFPETVTAVLNTYAVAGEAPERLSRLLANAATLTDLSAADEAAFRDQLIFLWETNEGGMAVLTRLPGSFVGPAADRWFYAK